MTYDTTCQYCGGECYDDEMHDATKCKQCFVEDCNHADTVRSYEGSSHHRARFSEHCIRCQAFREIRFYFANKTSDMQGTISAWEHDEVHLE